MSARVSEEVMTDDGDEYEFLMQASTVRQYTYKITLIYNIHVIDDEQVPSLRSKAKDAQNGN